MFNFIRRTLLQGLIVSGALMLPLAASTEVSTPGHGEPTERQTETTTDAQMNAAGVRVGVYYGRPAYYRPYYGRSYYYAKPYQPYYYRYSYYPYYRPYGFYGSGW